MKQNVYDNKPSYYFDTIRKELLNLIPTKCKGGNLLEIGAGKGNTLIYAKKHNYASKVYGVDISSIDNSYQSSPEIEKFVIGDIEKNDLNFNNIFFDVILCGDVLEHLVNPSDVIQKIKPLLSQNGVIIASIPNIREWATLKKIFFSGDFRYEDVGILDKTHLRFFCKKNIEELFTNNNMEILQLTSNIGYARRTKKIVNLLTFKIFEEFLTTQYYIVAKNPDKTVD